MNKYIKLVFLICLILILITTNISLVFRIRNLLTKNVLGVQYITKLNKDDLIFPIKDDELSFFYELRPGFRKLESSKWLGYTVFYNINSDGLNEQYNYQINKPNSVYRIITIGDSHTFGLYVNTEENFSEILESILNNKLNCNNINSFEVMNFGVPGYDISYTIKRLVRRGLKYNPDLVIWLINSVNIEKYNDMIIPIENTLREIQKSSSDSFTELYKVHSLAKKRIYELYGDKYMSSLSLESLKTISDYYQNKLLILTSSELSQEYRNSLKSLVNINSDNYFSKNLSNKYWNDELYLLPDGHPNHKAHNEIANDILNILLHDFLGSCKSK